jgi:hypothetical protein
MVETAVRRVSIDAHKVPYLVGNAGGKNPLLFSGDGADRNEHHGDDAADAPGCGDVDDGCQTVMPSSVFLLSVPGSTARSVMLHSLELQILCEIDDETHF